LGDTITKEVATEYLIYGINKKFIPDLKRYVKIPLTQGMVDACLSFIYSTGGRPFSTSTLLKKLNDKDYCGAADEFLRWDKAGGKVFPGLPLRRKRERDLFLS
jgi:lysozyme